MTHLSSIYNTYSTTNVFLVSELYFYRLKRSVTKESELERKV